ncbi:ATP-dependent DNA helicase PIF1, partial [Phenoliferia sp. Uapishka_3]
MGLKGERERKRAVVAAGEAGEEGEEEIDDDYGLPASLLGSPKWTQENVADALALARKFGRGHFLITLTCNPDWPELQEMLRSPSRNANLDPVVTNRIFHERLKAAVAWIKKHLGKMAYMVRVVEFHKRGLPHAHIIIRVSPECPFEDIDKVVSAELPDHPGPLRDAYLKHMQHSKSHLMSAKEKYSRCNKNGRCIYGFPHPVRPRTVIDQHGRMQFRRRKEESVWTSSTIPALLLFWQGHVHVDCIFTSDVFYYSYKYMYKGVDQASVRITADGEPAGAHPDDYFNARYLSACEADWRIMAYNVSKKEPSVKCLYLHLPDMQRHQYKRNSGSSTVSDLTHYLDLRPRSEPFVSMRYIEYFEACTFEKYHPGVHLEPTDFIELQHPNPSVQRQVVHFRTRGTRVARIQTLRPNQGEIFYLRAILMHEPALSWTDLLTHNGVLHQSFMEKARALGLFAEVNEGQYAMREAMEALKTPAQGRFLFSQLVLEGNMAIALWEEFKNWLCSDFLTDSGNADSARRRTLLQLNRFFEEQGKSCSFYGLPQPEQYSREVEIELEAFALQRIELAIHAASLIASLNPGQRAAFDTILASVRARDGRSFFLEAKAGCGKTYVLQALAAHLRSEGLIVLISASTGLAASLHTRGRTIHTLFRVPVNENNSNLRSLIEFHSSRAQLIHNSAAVVMDELGMTNRAVLECVDDTTRRATGIDRPLGGIPTIGLGDFHQVAPVVKGGGESATFDASIRSSILWDHFEILYLSERVRNTQDPEYANFIDQVAEDTSGNRIDLTPFLHHVQSVDQAIERLYPPHILEDPYLCLNRAWLSPVNSFVDDLNEEILTRLPGETMTYYSHDELRDYDGNLPDQPAVDFLHSQNENGIPPHELHLKVNVICVLMRNLSVERGLVKNANDHLLPRISFDFTPPYQSFVMRRRQFPLRLAYSTTFNSCQGMTIDGHLVLDFRAEPFAHGQLYTALSRIRNRECATVLLPGDDQTVANVVYKKLLFSEQDEIKVPNPLQPDKSTGFIPQDFAIQCADDATGAGVDSTMFHFAGGPPRPRDGAMVAFVAKLAVESPGKLIASPIDLNEFARPADGDLAALDPTADDYDAHLPTLTDGIVTIGGAVSGASGGQGFFTVTVNEYVVSGPILDHFSLLSAYTAPQAAKAHSFDVQVVYNTNRWKKPFNKGDIVMVTGCLLKIAGKTLHVQAREISTLGSAAVAASGVASSPAKRAAGPEAKKRAVKKTKGKEE